MLAIPVQLGGSSSEKVPLALQLVIIVLLGFTGSYPYRHEYTYSSPYTRSTSDGTITVFIPPGGLPHSTAACKKVVVCMLHVKC